MIYEVRPGEHICFSASKSIQLARKYNRKVQLRFNDVRLTVNKRLSEKHVVHTFNAILDARKLRYENSAAGQMAKLKRLAELKEKQSRIDSLFNCFPNNKAEAAAWIAKWVPLADDVGVESRLTIVAESLKNIGFISGHHVGDLEFQAGTASNMKKVEYVAGQVISQIERVGCVHPIIGKWSLEIASLRQDEQG